MSKRRYRTQQIIIDTPKSGEDVIIKVSIQDVNICEETGCVMDETPTIKQIYKFASHVATECVTVYDPVLGKDLTMSVAGLHEGICQYVNNWLLSENPDAFQDGKYVWH